MKEIQFVSNKAIIVNEKGEVLLLMESKDHETNTTTDVYTCPGGRMDMGEEPMENLVREVKEEVGYTIDVTEVQPIWVDQWHPVVKDEQWHIVGIYHKVPLGDNGDPVLSEEHSSFVWKQPKDIVPEETSRPFFAAIQALIKQTA